MYTVIVKGKNSMKTLFTALEGKNLVKRNPEWKKPTGNTPTWAEVVKESREKAAKEMHQALQWGWAEWEYVPKSQRF